MKRLRIPERAVSPVWLAVLLSFASIAAMGCAGGAKAPAATPANAFSDAAPAEAPPSPPPPPPPPPSSGASTRGPTGGSGDTDAVYFLKFPDVAKGAPGQAGGPAALAMNDPGETKSVSDAPHSAAMLIYTANLSLAVYEVEPGLDAVERIAREVGGYLSSRQDRAVVVRVPRDRFDDALTRIEKLGDVTHRDIKAQDVTDEFVDLKARLKNAYAIRERLNVLLAKAAVKEALEIEKELGRVTEEIERMEGKLKLLGDQMAFSMITVSFAPIPVEQVHDSSLLTPFPWLQQLGLRSLLNVHQ